MGKTSQHWYCFIDGAKNQPISEDMIKTLLRVKGIFPDTLVRQSKLDEWRPLSSHPRLAEVMGIRKSPLPLQTPSREKEISMNNKVWYYVADGDKSGPFTIDAVIELIEADRIMGVSLVWKEGLDEWIQASDCEELAGHFTFNSTPPSLPPDLSYTNTEDLAPNNDFQRSSKGMKNVTKVALASLAIALILVLGPSGPNFPGNGPRFIGFILGTGFAIYWISYAFTWIPRGLYWVIKRREMPYFNRVLWICWLACVLLFFFGELIK